MKKNWDKFYSKTYSLEYLIQNAFYHLKFFNAIWEESPKKILEVGVGTGSMSIFFSYLGLDVTGLDNDKDILKRVSDLTKKLNGKVKLVLGNALKLPFKSKSFDLIFHQGFLEHFEEKEIIELLWEQLRVSQTVVFSVPNNFYQKKDFGDERLLSKAYWDKLLQTNYNLIESQNYNPVRKTFFKGRLPYKVVQNMYFAKITKK
ncbi:class I SAM-dependent methyltransferase [Candidatus Daviesbacteria bacterium]|nr:class I SAM-dependent methyltransferase [Candidatus Daviesbacteria bacterium]